MALGSPSQWAAERAVCEKVVGVDHSELMHRTASRRNARAIRTGRAELHVEWPDATPPFEVPFDKFFTVDVYMFWTDPVTVLRTLASWMKPGGVVARTFQPRNRGATNEDARREGERIAESLRAAGFLDVRIEVLPLRPVDAVCVLGRAPTRAPAASGGPGR
jgi:SAM-dependent methyltransferase